MDRQIRALLTLAKPLHWPIVVKRELSLKAKLSIYWSILVPTLIHGHNIWVVTEGRRLHLQIAEVISLQIMAGLRLRNRECSSTI